MGSEESQRVQTGRVGGRWGLGTCKGWLSGPHIILGVMGRAEELGESSSHTMYTQQTKREKTGVGTRVSVPREVVRSSGRERAGLWGTPEKKRCQRSKSHCHGLTCALPPIHRLKP